MVEACARERNTDTAGVTPEEVMVETDAHETNDGTATVTQGEEMVGTGASASHDDPVRVTGNSAKNTKGKVVGEKRKRLSYTVTQSALLELELRKGNLDTKEGRQVVSDIFTKETREMFDVERIKT